MSSMDIASAQAAEVRYSLAAEWSLKLLRDPHEVNSFMSPERIGEWRDLVSQQDKVTAFQAPDFVLAWYESYASDFEPLLLLGLDSEGGLVGVMPLARRRGPHPSLVPAGAHQAEYSGWVATSEIDEAFPTGCVLRLKEEGLFLGTWNWQWLSPRTPNNWLSRPELRSAGIRFRLTSFENPIWSLERPEGFTFYGKHKSHKWKMNRLKRLGEVRLCRLDNTSLTDELFENFKTLYDVRQLGRHGVAPFREDPCKGPFHRRLIEDAQDTAVCFALIAGSTPIAFNFDLVDNKRVIGCMSPFDQRWFSCSPAKIIGDLVADDLSERGMLEFDLTPGGDEYKQELATKNEPVHYLEIFSSPLVAAKSNASQWLRSVAKNLLATVGLNRDQLVQMYKPFAEEPLLSAPGRLFQSLRRWVWAGDTSIVYQLDKGEVAAIDEGSKRAEFSADMLSDFLCYNGSVAGLSHQELMARAVRRINQGEHCYSLVENGVLTHWGWLQPKPKCMRLEGVGVELEVSPGDSVIHDVHGDPTVGGSDLRQNILQRLVADAFNGGAERIVATASESSNKVHQAFETAAFKPVRRVTRRCRLGQVSVQEQVL